MRLGKSLTDIGSRYILSIMKVISVHVDEREYEALKAIAARQKRPVAALIRESIARTTREAAGAVSIFDLPPIDAGRQLSTWTRDEIFDEMIER